MITVWGEGRGFRVVWLLEEMGLAYRASSGDTIPNDACRARRHRVQVRPLLEQAPDWPTFLAGGLGDDEREALRAGERTGRPLGSDAFVAGLEQTLDRSLARRKPGPKPVYVGS